MSQEAGDSRPIDSQRGFIQVSAPAKINLSLDILGRRPDGYHELRSIMQALELHDTLSVEPAPSLRLSCDREDLQDDQNLVLRAARLLQEATGCREGAHIILTKRIPTEAGLAGGSSDAAAALLALTRLWDLPFGQERLARLGAILGSDVPFFFNTPSALVEGRGEQVRRLPTIPQAHVVLCKPVQGVSTGRLFSLLPVSAYSLGQETERLLDALDQGVPPWTLPLSNTLQETATGLAPIIGRALAAFYGAGASNAIMTGSGSTTYALFPDERSARTTALTLEDTEWTVVQTRFAL